MSSKLKKNINMTDIILILILLLLIIIILILCAKYFVKPKQAENQANQGTTIVGNNNKKNENTYTVPRTEEEIIKNLSTMGERDRMNYYFGVYFKHLENKEYESAYNLLYPEFKTQYFPTLEKFEEYVKKTYPEECAWSDDDISRQGDIYVLNLKIIDVLGKRESEKTQRVVIQEKNYNDFVISFQII